MDKFTRTKKIQETAKEICSLRALSFEQLYKTYDELNFTKALIEFETRKEGSKTDHIIDLSCDKNKKIDEITDLIGKYEWQEYEIFFKLEEELGICLPTDINDEEIERYEKKSSALKKEVRKEIEKYISDKEFTISPL